MATENPVKMISSLGTAGLLSDSMKSPDSARQDAYYDGYAEEFGLLLKDGTCFETTQKEDLFRRSGSAPPSVEGSLVAMGGLFPHYSTNPIYLPEDTTTNNNISSSDPLGAEEQLRSDPAYLAYYYSHVNLNPRLPPPLISRENWRVAQWIGAMQEKGNLQSLDDGGSRSLFLSQPVLKSHKEESEALTEDMAGSLLRQYSTEWVEGGGDGLIGLSPSGLGAARCKSFADLIQEEFPGRTRSSAFHLSRPSSRVGQDDGDDRIVESGSTAHTRSSTPAMDLQMAAVLGSRSSTPNPLLQGGNLPNGHSSAAGSQYSHMNSTLGRTFGMLAHSTIERSFQNLSISDMQELVSSEEHGKTQKKPPRASSSAQPSSAYAQALLQLQSGTLSPNLYSAAMPSSYMASGNHHHQHPYYQNSHLGSSMYSPNYGLGSYSFDPASLLPAVMMGSPSGMEGTDMQYMYKMGNPSNATFDPAYIQYMQRVAQEARAASSARGGEYMVSSSAYADLFAMQKSSNGSLASPVLSGSTAVAAKRVADPTDESCICSLLEEFKNSKTKCFELSDITGKVLEFSVDQHGSRFIQQKLEVAKPEEKEFVFREVFPRALTLMTDVFGNYVIQKFFEHGTPQHKTELANQLVGHVLSLSLQMYGCRVIQKAIEALDVDQQTRIVAELDGNVIRCVRDQNGNHVIQKCIECVPQDRIQFIISAFFGQVVTLSTHPYGCRVIQRVLEHCSDEVIQQHVMDEILQSICNLSHDQYGNYVVQHILEHGNPHERSKIIKKLAGQFVPMSQHKFASNVVEKCLQFGRHTERQILINEMLGDTDENEPLQAMMKDQFANYVVQKVLETCDEKQREILLARIKVHLHTLKKYTYGKHIVARVEKLVVAGERRNASQSAQKPTI